MGTVPIPVLFGELFKTTRVKILQSVASEELEDMIKWLISEVECVSEKQSKFEDL